MHSAADAALSALVMILAGRTVRKAADVPSDLARSRLRPVNFVIGTRQFPLPWTACRREPARKRAPGCVRRLIGKNSSATHLGSY